MTTHARLLLVDDEPSLAVVLTDRLQSEGYVVTTLGDGDIALKTATSDSFDLIILDGMLPGRDGYDVCRTLRQRGVKTPILMLSARGQVIETIADISGVLRGTRERS